MIQSTIRPSGYRPCACRDCFEIAIGAEGAMCHDCQDAGCTGEGECSAPGAYGGELELEDDASEAVTVPPAAEPDPLLPSVLQGMITCAQTARPIITAECQRKGFYIVSHGSYDPRIVIPRLVAALIAITPSAAETLAAPDSSFRLLTEEALNDEQHEFWAGRDAERLLLDLTLALNAAAPPGFVFMVEGAFHNMGFFRA